MVTRLTMPGPRRCFGTSKSPGPTAAFARGWARLSRIDVLVIDDWAMAPIQGTGTPGFLGDLLGPVSGAVDDTDLAHAGE
jgi:hypothetical protein